MSLEKARELKHSLLWGEVEKELKERIGAELGVLRKCPKEDLEKHQIRISIFEEVLRLPQDVIDREEAP